MTATTSDANELARHAMVVSQLRTSAVNDPRVVEAMASVPREDFVGEENRATAYRDRELPLGGGRQQNTPLATGLLLVQADVQPTESVLLIGAAGGYTAALLSRLGGRVVAVESDATLAGAARVALAPNGNVELVEGPLAQGAAEAGPFDVLVIDGAVGELPDTLVRQVRPGGRVVAGLVEGGVARLAAGVRGEGVVLVPFSDIESIVLPGFERPRAFHFPG
ncbi:protein-L-isoaspartate O-methyltransferase family protein [Sphingomonas sp.]|uniref:protein-L-isoaspartate O-methyltransferase family protein n=1 Tax=Sphingomonas sp. TaxID=28214 RepID=UPI002DD63B97|nr:protein-L-isoaspartate O-methyltransferase [Sphingomonas sp.]